MSNQSFSSLGLHEDIVNCLEQKGFSSPTDIQSKAIPILLNESSHIIGQAQTGTGKTAAFGLPILHHAITDRPSGIHTLILTPTRELTLQVHRELSSFHHARDINIVAIYGGQSIEKQAQALKKATIIVGTPGRVLDHMSHKRLRLDALRYLVLDEADEMLNAGFIEDIDMIISAANPERRIVLFSATMPKAIRKLAETYMPNYAHIQATHQSDTARLTHQSYVEVSEAHKCNALCRIIDATDAFYGLVFCRTKRDVDQTAEKLIARGYHAESLHGDLSQHQRERVLQAFRKGRCQILVVTDVASRGLDISNLTHVINYALPMDNESYVHRIGRTGRAGKTGAAISLVSRGEHRRLLRIESFTKQPIEKMALPSSEEIAKKKRSTLLQTIHTHHESEQHHIYQDMAKRVLAEHDPITIVSSLIHLAFHAKLDGSTHPEITSQPKKQYNKMNYRDSYSHKKKGNKTQRQRSYPRPHRG